MLKTASPGHHKFHNTKECREPTLVMAHWYGPLWDTLRPQKGPGFKPSGVQVKLMLVLCQ
jgi:hypothetical protein